MKKEKIFIFICLVLLSACSPSSLDGIVIEKAADGYKLSIDGRETYIKGEAAHIGWTLPPRVVPMPSEPGEVMWRR